MVHLCKVQCHTMSQSEMDVLGINQDKGKWLPFAIDLGIISAVKLSSDDVDEPTYNCSTVFCSDGSSFILDTPFEQFSKIWSDYLMGIFFIDNGNLEDSTEL